MFDGMISSVSYPGFRFSDGNDCRIALNVQQINFNITLQEDIVNWDGQFHGESVAGDEGGLNQK
jgi:hypothetical protein